MSVVRVSRKGKQQFAFGDNGEPFEIDVTVEYWNWQNIADTFRLIEGKPEEIGTIPAVSIPALHQAALTFASNLAGKDAPQSVGEALDFLARLTECYKSIVGFFQAKSEEERASPATSEQELQFSEEAA
jgi:hypothetical protein